jgi:hypothetical protein
VTDKRQRRRKPLEEKESAHWRESWRACQALRQQLPTSTLLVNIDDMEADIYEVFAAALAQEGPRAELLIRSHHNRQIESQEQRLWEYLSERLVAGTLKVKVPRRPGQPARIATLHIRFCEVLLAAPEHKGKQGPLKLWAVEAREVHRPKKGTEPILWRLLSTLPVTTAQEAVEKVRWYAVRWNIEVFHKIVKSVCRAEAHQMEADTQLERLLMLDLLVAWRVQVLTQVGRQKPDLPASDYFDQSEWKVLYSYINPGRTLPTKAPKLGQMMEWIGRLGGFIKSKANPHPGSITLSRGLGRLSDMATAWSLQQTLRAKARCHL